MIKIIWIIYFLFKLQIDLKFTFLNNLNKIKKYKLSSPFFLIKFKFKIIKNINIYIFQRKLFFYLKKVHDKKIKRKTLKTFLEINYWIKGGIIKEK
jgi:hypothetical protein